MIPQVKFFIIAIYIQNVKSTKSKFKGILSTAFRLILYVDDFFMNTPNWGPELFFLKIHVTNKDFIVSLL